MVGRPSKYDEKLINLSIAVPQSLLDKIENYSNSKYISRNEVIISMLIANDPNDVSMLISKFNELKKALREQSKDLASYKEKLDKYFNKNLGQIYEELKKPDDNLKEFLNYFAVKKKRWLENGITEKELFEQYELWLASNKNLKVKNKKDVLIHIKRFIRYRK